MKWLRGVALAVALLGSTVVGCMEPDDDFFSGDSTSWAAKDDNVWRNDADPPMDPDVWHLDHE